MKTLLIMLPVVSALAFSPVTFADHPRHKLGAVLKQLDLTEAQRLDLRQVMKESKQDISVYRQDMQELDRQLRALIQSSEWDAAAVQAVIEQKHVIKANIAANKVTDRHYIWHNLNEDQQQKYVALTADKKETKRDRRPMRMLSKLNLSDDQEAEIKEILAAQKDSHSQLRASMKELKQQEFALIKAQDLDLDAWQALHAESQTIGVQMAMSHAYNRHQIWNLLDQKQQAKLQKMADKRAEKAKDWRQSKRDKRDQDSI